MSERYIKIRNWERFQQKDVWRKSNGTPPWIKAYTKLLHDDDWAGLSQSQQGVLINLWLMYASAGRSVGEAGAKRRLCRSDAEAKWWRSNLESLNHAGFIEFESQPNRAPVAPRVEKSREERTSQEKPRVEKSKPATSGWVHNLNSYTGCRMVRGEIGQHHVRDVLGTDRPPNDWPHERPSRVEIRKALEAA